MPAAAVVGAVAAIGIAAEVGTTFAIVAAVGATVGAVGAVTKNKTLSIAGMALGAVGGIGALASSAGVFGAEAAGAAGEVTAAAAPTGSYTTANLAASGLEGAAGPGNAIGSEFGTAASVTDAAGGSAWGNVVDTVAGSAPPSMSALGTASPDATAAAVPAAATDSTPYTGPQGDAEGLNASGDVTRTAGRPDDVAQAPYQRPISTATPAVPAVSAVPAPAAPLAPGTNPAPSVAPDGLVNGGVATPTNGIPAAAGAQPTALEGIMGSGPDVGATPANQGPWSKIMNFIEKHPTLALGGLTAASSFLSGAMDPKNPATVQALEARSRESDAAARKSDTQTAILSRQLKNMGGAIPAANANPGRGLING